MLPDDVGFSQVMLRSVSFPVILRDASFPVILRDASFPVILRDESPEESKRSSASLRMTIRALRMTYLPVILRDESPEESKRSFAALRMTVKERNASRMTIKGAQDDVFLLSF